MSHTFEKTKTFLQSCSYENPKLHVCWLIKGHICLHNQPQKEDAILPEFVNSCHGQSFVDIFKTQDIRGKNWLHQLTNNGPFYHLNAWLLSNHSDSSYSTSLWAMGDYSRYYKKWQQNAPSHSMIDFMMYAWNSIRMHKPHLSAWDLLTSHQVRRSPKHSDRSDSSFSHEDTTNTITFGYVSVTPRSIGFQLEVNISGVVAVKCLYILISAEGCLCNVWSYSTLDIVLVALWFLGNRVHVSRYFETQWSDVKTIEDIHWRMWISQVNLGTLWITWKSLIPVVNNKHDEAHIK